MKQDHGSALVTLANGKQVGAAVHLEVVGEEVHLAVTAKDPDTATWDTLYTRVIGKSKTGL